MPAVLETALHPAPGNAANRRRRVASLALALVAICQAVAAQAPPVPLAPVPRFVVVLDAAHGGDDAGARLTGGRTEKAFTLAFSVRLRSLLAARGIQVVTTREQDAAVELDRRAEIANHANAQACLSLHGTQSGSGVHLFVSNLQPVPPVRFAAWKTAQAASVARSLALARVLNSALEHAGLGVTVGRMALPAVDSMTCPAVAVEIAPETAAGLRAAAGVDAPDYEARVAAALAAALLEWRTEAGRAESGRTEAGRVEAARPEAPARTEARRP